MINEEKLKQVLQEKMAEMSVEERRLYLRSMGIRFVEPQRRRRSVVANQTSRRTVERKANRVGVG